MKDSIAKICIANLAAFSGALPQCNSLCPGNAVLLPALYVSHPRHLAAAAVASESGPETAIAIEIAPSHTAQSARVANQIGVVSNRLIPFIGMNGAHLVRIFPRCDKDAGG